MFDSFDFLTVFCPFCLCVVRHTLGLMCTHGHPHISSHASSQNTLDTLQFTSRMLTCWLDPDLVAVPEKSTLFSYFGLWKVPELVGAQFPFGSGAVWLQTAAFGSGAVDSWSAISGRPENHYAGNTGVTLWKYCVGWQTVNTRSGNRSICGLMMTWSPCRWWTRRHEKSLQWCLWSSNRWAGGLCTQDVWKICVSSEHNTRQLFRKVETMIRNSVCIASSSVSACRMRHGCGQWNSLISKQNIYAVWLRCMCASVKRTRSRQCSGDEGCLYTNLREFEWNFYHFNLHKFDSGWHNSNVNVWKLNVCILSGRLSLRDAECWLGWRRQGSSQLFWNHRKHLVVVWIFLFLVQSWWWLITATQRISVWLAGIRGVQKIVSSQATKYVYTPCERSWLPGADAEHSFPPHLHSQTQLAKHRAHPPRTGAQHLPGQSCSAAGRELAARAAAGWTEHLSLATEGTSQAARHADASCRRPASTWCTLRIPPCAPPKSHARTPWCFPPMVRACEGPWCGTPRWTCWVYCSAMCRGDSGNPPLYRPGEAPSWLLQFS